RWTVRGSSMWPSIRDGATVVVTPGGVRSLRAGELVAFARGSTVVVHRVVAVEPVGLRCRGDARSREDGVVAWADVLGRAEVLEQRPLSLRWPRARELRALLRAALGALRTVRT
ncbi:MAG: hypothetical protein KA978_31905, partial [Deltaproteobacteria bacterium]|nr:hypothetical protein [Deltaproteobacteria bacterium]